MVLNGDFESRTLSLFGEERYKRFEAALNEEPSVSVRFNAVKHPVENAEDPVPWAPEASYLARRPVFTADPLFHAGCYYVQEASSMFLGQVVRQLVKEPVRVLDLCAAPGGKSTHLLQLLPQGSLLVSNEPVPLRAQVLAENIIKWGNQSAVVTKNEPADYSCFRNFFDIVVVDAPCSGEGMFRKDAFAVEQWNLSVVRQCVALQQKILDDVWPALRPGGLLVYSTCTFNAEEDEESVKRIVAQLGAEPLAVSVDDAWGITGALTGDKLPVYRFIPGYTRGEGFFLAVLRKDGDEPPAQPRLPKIRVAPTDVRNEVARWLKNPEVFDFALQDDTVLALPKEHTAAIMSLQQKLKVLHAALPLATVKNKKLIPHHALAMSVNINKEAFECVEVTREQALAYLHRETLDLSSHSIGYLLLTYEGVPVGFVKNVGNRANNMYPSEWRIRKNPMEL